MCFWYSFRVVAPTQRSSPRASIGLSMLEASIDPSAAPAPTTVCSSSMKRMISPSDSATSFSTAFRRSSNSPRYLAPAISAPRSRATSFLFLSDSGTSPETMRWARPFHDRGLAHAGLADEHGVVLGAAGEDLHHAADLLVAADDGIELALARQLGEVAAVLLERLVALLGVGIGHALVAADLAQDLEDAVLVTPCALQDLARGVLAVEQRDEEVLGRDVLVLEALRFLQRRLEDGVEPRRDAAWPRPACAAGRRARARLLRDRAARSRPSCPGRRGRRPPSWDSERLEEVLGRDFGMVGLSAAVCAAAMASWALTVN